MAIELLREIAVTRLPTTFRDSDTVDQIRLLRAAELLAAVTSPPQARAPFASVLCITAKGRALLRSPSGQA
jgi:hypothetical protein